MKKILILIAAIFIITSVIPLAFLFRYGRYSKEPKNESQPEENTSAKVTVYIKSEDRVVEMDKNQYLKEVVSAEMPVSFDIEALKAQAVAARSYLDSRINASKGQAPENIHKGADICTDPSHCKAWISEEKRRESWGSDADKSWDKISRAVDETDGEVITYNGEIISAVFHSTSSGRTENSKDVWGGDKPYLVSVDSPGDKISPKYKSEKKISLDDFKKIAQENIDGVDFSKELIGKITRSGAGGILTVSIGGKEIKGTKLRSLYGLRSTNVQITYNTQNVVFDVKGYGHGVGMSQYGANYLAEQGKNYKEILKTYYTGVEITKEGR